MAFLARLAHAFSWLVGINVFDTSPYYGRSEYILGDALDALREEFPRSTYYLQTKVGRYGYTTKDMDYSAERIRASVAESMKRLRTDYLDVVLAHDVEFVPFEQVVGPDYVLDALFDLKVNRHSLYPCGKKRKANRESDRNISVGFRNKASSSMSVSQVQEVTESLIRSHVLIYLSSIGYPLPVLLKIAEHQHAQGQPLDVVLSYCHYSLQNTKFAEYAPKFRAAGVRYVMSASPLAMALFRDAGPPAWHPAHAELRAAAAQAALVAKNAGLNISELASKFAFTGRDTFNLQSTVIGLENKDDVKKAIEAWQSVKRRQRGEEQVPESEVKVLEEIHALLAPYKDYSWESPTAKERA